MSLQLQSPKITCSLRHQNFALYKREAKVKIYITDAGTKSVRLQVQRQLRLRTFILISIVQIPNRKTVKTRNQEVIVYNNQNLAGKDFLSRFSRQTAGYEPNGVAQQAT